MMRQIQKKADDTNPNVEVSPRIMFLFSVHTFFPPLVVVEVSPRIMFLFSVYTVIAYSVSLYPTFLKKNSGNIDDSLSTVSQIFLENHPNCLLLSTSLSFRTHFGTYFHIERTMGLEPTITNLEGWCITILLHPHNAGLTTNVYIRRLFRFSQQRS